MTGLMKKLDGDVVDDRSSGECSFGSIRVIFAFFRCSIMYEWSDVEPL